MSGAANRRKIGAIEVARVEESLGPAFAPAQFYADYDPALLERHRDFMIPRCFDAQSGELIASIHTWVLKTPHHTILIDTCAGNHKQRPKTPGFNMLDTPWLARLAAAGVTPRQVDIVMCTHLHVDHVGWNTRLDNGRWVPTFPNAKYIFSKIDHDYWSANPRGPGGAINRGVYQDSVLPVVESKQAVLVGDAHEIETGIVIEKGAGHTPGHCLVKAHSGQDRALFAGDALHSPLQVFEPQLSTLFCENKPQAVATRRSLLRHCAETGALLMPAHFPPPHCGTVTARGDKFAFAFAD